MMDWSIIWQYQAEILQGLAYTAVISVIAIFGSVLLGTLLGCLRLLRQPLLSEVIAVYVEIIRNIPVIVKLFLLYYVIGLDAFPTGLVALTVHQSGYIADVVTAGFRSIHPEQGEAGYAQGLSRFQIFAGVLLPQVTRVSLPPLTNQCIEVVKNSAVVMLIGVQELTFETREISQATLRSFEAAAVATALYGMLALIVVGGMNQLGRCLNWHEKR